VPHLEHGSFIFPAVALYNPDFNSKRQRKIYEQVSQARHYCTTHQLPQDFTQLPGIKRYISKMQNLLGGKVIFGSIRGHPATLHPLSSVLEVVQNTPMSGAR